MRKIWLAVVTAALVLYGCSGVRVAQDYDPATDFGVLKTYRWMSPTQEETGDPRIDNPLRDTRIRAAVDRRLAEKGYARSSDSPATFRVRYEYVLRQKLETNGSGIGFGIGSYGRHGGIAVGTGSSVREYDEGSLVIDFVDGTSETLLWRGTGSQRFRQYDDPDKTSRDINALVERILAQFPPPNMQ